MTNIRLLQKDGIPKKAKSYGKERKRRVTKQMLNGREFEALEGGTREQHDAALVEFDLNLKTLQKFR
ncbi:hypothetical protein FPRO03_02089 [Fusarium proliferatum]|nr:hypothetical protein FPRO03_02089 [Fusarium proliferatum]